MMVFGLLWLYTSTARTYDPSRIALISGRREGSKPRGRDQMTIAGRVDRKMKPVPRGLASYWPPRLLVGSAILALHLHDRRKWRRPFVLAYLVCIAVIASAARAETHRPPLGPLRRRERAGARPRIRKTRTLGRRRLAWHARRVFHPTFSASSRRVHAYIPFATPRVRRCVPLVC